MTAYPNLINEPKILNMKTRDDEIKQLKNQTKKHDLDNIIKPLKNEKEYYKKKYKSLNKEKLLLNITETLIGSRSAIGSSTMSFINPTIGIVLTSSTDSLASLATLITNDYILKKISYTKLGD